MPEKNVSSPQRWKKEVKWFCAAIVLSIIFVGVLTEFEYGMIAIRQGSIYHFHPVKGVIYFTALVITLKNSLLIVSMVMEKAPVLGFIFAMIVPVLTLLCVYFFYDRALIVHEEQAAKIARNQMWLLGIFITALTLIEVRILLAVRKFLGRNYSSD